jgi:hypothetical protein
MVFAEYSFTVSVLFDNDDAQTVAHRLTDV